MEEKQVVQKWFNGMKQGDCKEVFQKAFNMNINFDEKDLNKVDLLIDELYPLGHEPLEALVRLFGFYFGEVIVQTIPSAKWNIEQIDKFDDILNATITYKEGNKTNVIQPFQRVIRYWFNRELTLSSLYRYVNLTDLQLEDTNSLPQEEVKTYFNGDKVRLVDPKRNLH